MSLIPKQYRELMSYVYFFLPVLERKAERTLSVLRQLSTKSLLKLYKALVIPQMEFAASVWQNSSSADTLNKIQRKGQALCLGVPATSTLYAVEVEAGVLPLELRREELSIREGGKIMSKDNSQPIKELWNEWRDSYRPHLVSLICNCKIWKQTLVQIL